MRMPVAYLPHGGGPCFFMDDPDGIWTGMGRFLRELPASLPERPRAILIVSGLSPAITPASNMAARRPAAMSGTTRSSDWRLRSTTHSTSPRRATIGSTMASYTAPSSSSASPSSAIWRPPRGTSKCPAT